MLGLGFGAERLARVLQGEASQCLGFFDVRDLLWFRV